MLDLGRNVEYNTLSSVLLVILKSISRMNGILTPALWTSEMFMVLKSVWGEELFQKIEKNRNLRRNIEYF